MMTAVIGTFKKWFLVIIIKLYCSIYIYFHHYILCQLFWFDYVSIYRVLKQSKPEDLQQRCPL